MKISQSIFETEFLKIINNQEIKVLEAEFVQKKVDNTGIIKEIDKKNLGIK